MKQLGIAVCAAALLASSVAAGAQQTTPGADFIEAVKKSDGTKAIALLGSQPSRIVDTKDTQGDTPLVIAIRRSDEQWTGFLLNKGADPNLAGSGGETPLIAAARFGFDTAVDWLIGLGARVDATNRMGETALIVAVQQREPRVVQLLLNAGANPDKADSAAGYSARDYAARDAHSRDILKMIESKKPKAGAAAK